MYSLIGEGIWARILEELYTFCAFCITATVLPALALSFIGKYFMLLLTGYYFLFPP